jgi:XTP/dITP diphosphohydrolase
VSCARSSEPRVLVATRSRHKAAEIARILGRTRAFQLITLNDAGITESAAEDQLENAETFLENARAKALSFARLTGTPVLADDSGLEVFALGMAPGVRTRRFALDAGIQAEGPALDAANNQLLLERLANVPDAQRGARYVCALSFATPAGDVLSSIGTCTGAIARVPRGSGGFGYDPLFLIPDLQITFAELSSEQKDARSHRARALRALAALL